MDSAQPARAPFDADRYVRRSREGPCFVCAILAGHPDHSHHVVYEDADIIAFLARWPVLLGHCLVAPKRHVESWVRDLDEPQFLALQRVVHPGGQGGGRGRASRADVLVEPWQPAR